MPGGSVGKTAVLVGMAVELGFVGRDMERMKAGKQHRSSGKELNGMGKEPLRRYCWKVRRRCEMDITNSVLTYLHRYFCHKNSKVRKPG